MVIFLGLQLYCESSPISCTFISPIRVFYFSLSSGFNVNQTARNWNCLNKRFKQNIHMILLGTRNPSYSLNRSRVYDLKQKFKGRKANIEINSQIWWSYKSAKKKKGEKLRKWKRGFPTALENLRSVLRSLEEVHMYT